jgi:hypothetical protein
MAAGLLLLTLLAVAWNESRKPRPVVLVPTLTGQPEYCLTCHADVPQISAAHPTETFGCASCHGGQPLALDADLAHSTMRGGRNPSDFSVVEASCGGANCHSGSAAEGRDHIQRVLTSVQSTYAGAIATVRYAFGAQSNPGAQQGIYAIDDPHSATGLAALAAFDPARDGNPSVQTFAANCLNCHLSAQPLPGAHAKRARFTGCAACHAPTAGEAIALDDPTRPIIHQLTTAIPYTQCNTCHNRGNYSMRDLLFHPRTDAPADRLRDYYQPIAQFTRCEYTLDCVDCHTRTEAMGDGDIHGNQKEIQYVRCETCHGTPTELPPTKTLTDPNDIAFRLALLNPVVDLKIGDTILVTEKGEPLWNIRALPGGAYELFGKAIGQRFTFRPVMGSRCTQNPEDQSSASCHNCHSVQR